MNSEVKGHFAEQHENIDESQKRLAGEEGVQIYKEVWAREVNKTQAFCNEKSEELEDDSVLEDGLKDIAKILQSLIIQSGNEAGMRTAISHLEHRIDKIINQVEQVENEEMYAAAKVLLEGEPEHEEIVPMPSFRVEGMFNFAHTPTRNEYQDLIDGMQTEEERFAFIRSITDTVGENNEMGIEVSEQQSMRLEQLQLFGLMMQMFAIESGDQSKFLGSQIRNHMNEVMGVDSHGEFYAKYGSEEKLKEYQYQVLLNPKLSLKSIIPKEAFSMIELRTTLPRSHAQREDLYTVEFRDPSSRTELHEKKLQILQWFRFYSHYGEVGMVLEEDLAPEIQAAEESVTEEKIAELNEKVRIKMQELKEDNIDRWRNGYETTDAKGDYQWVPGMNEQQIKHYMQKITEESRAQELRKYALKHNFDPNTLSPEKRELWNVYNDVFDPKDQAHNLTDASWDTIRKELMINAPLIMMSGGVASLARTGISKVAAFAVGRIGILNGLNVAYQTSKIVRAGAYIGLTLTEGIAFEAVHSSLLKNIGLEEEWLGELNLPEAMQRIFWSTVTLGLFHGAGRLGGGIGQGIDDVTLSVFGEAARKITDSGTRKLVQKVLIEGNLEAATMLLMGAVQTGVYGGSVDEVWESLTSSDALFHAYLAAYSLKAGHHLVQPFKPGARKVNKEKSKKQKDKPNPEFQGGSELGANSVYKKGDVLVTPDGRDAVVLQSVGDRIVLEMRADGSRKTMTPAEVREMVQGAFVRAEALSAGYQVESFSERALAELFANNGKEYSPEKLVDLLARGNQEIFDAPVGVSEGYSLRGHTVEVLRRFETHFKSTTLPGGLDPGVMRLALAIHDVGKPKAAHEGAKDRQHEYTMEYADMILKKSGYPENLQNIVKSLISGDPIGGVIRGHISAQEAAIKVNAMAEKAGMPKAEFFDLLMIYYTADTSSYPGLKRQLFTENHRKELHLNEGPAVKVDALRRQLGLSDRGEVISVEGGSFTRGGLEAVVKNPLQHEILRRNYEIAKEYDAVKDTIGDFANVYGRQKATPEAVMELSLRFENLERAMPEFFRNSKELDVLGSAMHEAGIRPPLELLESTAVPRQILPHLHKTKGMLRRLEAESIGGTIVERLGVYGVKIRPEEVTISHKTQLLALEAYQRQAEFMRSEFDRSGLTIEDVASLFSNTSGDGLLKLFLKGEISARDYTTFNAREANIAYHSYSTYMPGITRLRSYIKLKNQMAALETSSLPTAEKQIQREILRECEVMLMEGKFGDPLSHGTNSTIWDGLASTGGKLLSSGELRRQALVRRSGEGSMEGGHEFAETISAGRAIDGFATARAYAKLNVTAEGYVDPVSLGEKVLGERVREFEEYIHIRDQKNDWFGAQNEREVTIAELTRYYQARDRLKLDPSLVESKPYEIVFGFKAQEGVQIVDTRGVMPGDALSGEVTLHTQAVDFAKTLETVYVPRENIADARQQLVRVFGQERAAEISVRSLESVDLLGEIVGPGYANVYESTYDQLHGRREGKAIRRKSLIEVARQNQ